MGYTGLNGHIMGLNEFKELLWAIFGNAGLKWVKLD